MSSKFYIEAYRSDDSMMLGNLDGQCVIYANQYKRTSEYKGLKSIKVSRDVSYWVVKDSNFKTIERIDRHGLLRANARSY